MAKHTHAPKTSQQTADLKEARDASPYRGVSFDAVYNYLSGIGGRNDKSMATEYMMSMTYNHQALTNLNRVSWIASKIVSKKARDMLRSGYDLVWEDSGRPIREGREKNTEMDAVRKAIAAYNADAKLVESKIWSRLYGGSIALFGIDGQDLTEPLPVKDGHVDYSSVTKGSLKYVHIFDRWRAAHSGVIDSDPNSPNCGNPLVYIINSTDVSAGQQVHWTRVIRFDGKKVPWFTWRQNACWHDSELQVLVNLLKQYDSTTQGITHLIQEANIDVVKAKGLIKTLGTAKGQAAIEERYGQTARHKSMFNMLIIDQDAEDYQRHPFQFSGLDRIWEKSMIEIAGATDYPVTVLFGRSPAGMNATGESDLQIYYDDLAAIRETELRPQHGALLEIIVRSTLGRLPDGFSFAYRPLWEPTAMEKSQMQTNRANRDKVYVDMGVVSVALVARELKEDSVYRTMTQDDVDMVVELGEMMPDNDNADEPGIGNSAPVAGGKKAEGEPQAPEDEEEGEEGDGGAEVGDGFNPDQPRDEGGRWLGEGGGTVGSTKSGKEIVAPAHNAAFSSVEANRQNPEKDFIPIAALEHVQSNSLGFSRQDHFDAHKTMMAAAKAQFSKGNVERAYHLAAVSRAHKWEARNYGKGLPVAKGAA